MHDSSSPSADFILASVSRFLKWWGQELLFLLRLFQKRKGESNRQVMILRLPLDQEANELLEQALPGQRVELYIDESITLSKELTLPDADTKTTAGMVELQQARYLPLQLHLLYTGWHRLPGTITRTYKADSESDSRIQQQVRLYTVKRSSLSDLLGRLADKRLVLEQVFVGDVELPSLLPVTNFRPLHLHRLKQAGMVAALLTLILLMPKLWFWKLSSENSTVTHQIEHLREDVQQISQLQLQLDEQQLRSDFLARQTKADRFAHGLLLLTQVSPDSVWLRELNYDKGRIRLSGQAESAADWALQLEKLPAIEKVQLQNVSANRSITPINTTDQSEPKKLSESFDMTLSIKVGVTQ